MIDLGELVRAAIKKFDDRPEISPRAVAMEVMQTLDPDCISIPEVYTGCDFHIRQLARGELRRPPPKPLPLFPDFPSLQARYPSSKSKDGEDPIYVRLDHMTQEDVDYNVARGRAEIKAKSAHLDALVAWAAKYLSYVTAE